MLAVGWNTGESVNINEAGSGLMHRSSFYTVL